MNIQKNRSKPFNPLNRADLACDFPLNGLLYKHAYKCIENKSSFKLMMQTLLLEMF